MRPELSAGDKAPQRWAPMSAEQARAESDLRTGRWRAIGLMALFVVATTSVFLALHFPLYIVCAIEIMWIGPAVSFGRAQTKLATAYDELFFVDSQRYDDILVEMWVEVDGVILGGDRGVLWADETGLCFYGHRSWFRLASPGLAEVKPRFRCDIPGELELYKGLTILTTARANVRIGMRVISSPDGGRGLGFGPLRISGRVAWVQALTEPSPVPTELPPLELAPDFKGPRGKVFGYLEVLCGGFGSILFFGSFFPPASPGNSFAMAAGAALLVAPGRLVVSAVRARCRRAKLRVA